MDSVAHKKYVRRAGANARKETYDEEEVCVKGLLEKTPKVIELKKRFERIREIGAWHPVIPNLLNGTILFLGKWRNNAQL